MPGTTSKGFPYPLGTEPVADGDDAIKNLAQSVDSKVGVLASGLASVVLSSQIQNSITVTFPAGRFVAAPNVVATSESGNYVAMSTSPTTTNVLIWASSKTGVSSSGTVPVRWIAHQP